MLWFLQIIVHNLVVILLKSRGMTAVSPLSNHPRGVVWKHFKLAIATNKSVKHEGKDNA